MNEIFFIFAVSTDALQKQLGEIGTALKQLELDVENYKVPQGDGDKFEEVMSVSFKILIVIKRF